MSSTGGASPDTGDKQFGSVDAQAESEQDQQRPSTPRRKPTPPSKSPGSKSSSLQRLNRRDMWGDQLLKAAADLAAGGDDRDGSDSELSESEHFLARGAFLLTPSHELSLEKASSICEKMNFKGLFSLTKTATGILFKFSEPEDYQAVFKKGFHKVTNSRFYKKATTLYGGARRLQEVYKLNALVAEGSLSYSPVGNLMKACQRPKEVKYQSAGLPGDPKGTNDYSPFTFFSNSKQIPIPCRPQKTFTVFVLEIPEEIPEEDIRHSLYKFHSIVEVTRLPKDAVISTGVSSTGVAAGSPGTTNTTAAPEKPTGASGGAGAPSGANATPPPIVRVTLASLDECNILLQNGLDFYGATFFPTEAAASTSVVRATGRKSIIGNRVFEVVTTSGQRIRDMLPVFDAAGFTKIPPPAIKTIKPVKTRSN